MEASKSGSPKADDDRRLDREAELLQHAYTRCTTRYNEIYTSVWTIFSFLAAGAGILVGFSKDSDRPWLSVVAAAFVILAWYVVLFCPLNRYGNQVAAEAARLEDEINTRFFAGTRAFQMFSNFAQRKSGASFWKRNFTEGGRVEVRLFWAIAATVVLVAWFVRAGALAPKTGEPWWKNELRAKVEVSQK
jgi:hypothetical protein